jgi:hypothetical protein
MSGRPFRHTGRRVMMAVTSAARMRAVTDEDDLKARGDAIYERIYGVPRDPDPDARRPRPIVNVSVLAHEAGLGRDTLYKVMAGNAALKSVQAVESALDDIEQRPADYESPDYIPSESEQLDVVEMHGLYGVARVVVRARPDRMEDEIAAVIRAIRTGMNDP